MALKPDERFRAAKPRLLDLLAEVEASGWCRRTLLLRPETLESRGAKGRIPAADPWEQTIAGVIQHVEDSETGLALFVGEDRAVAVVPPFPIAEDSSSLGADISPLVRMLTREILVGTVLLRLGRYAVGVLRGESLVASKTGSRHVKSRHRAGGTSQRRFERSRERLIRELFDKTCEVARTVFAPYHGGIDYVLMGGETHTLHGFVRRCSYLKGFEQRLMKRRLAVERPGQRALAGIAREVWMSRVVTFEPSV